MLPSGSDIEIDVAERTEPRFGIEPGDCPTLEQDRLDTDIALARRRSLRSSARGRDQTPMSPDRRPAIHVRTLCCARLCAGCATTRAARCRNPRDTAEGSSVLPSRDLSAFSVRHEPASTLAITCDCSTARIAMERTTGVFGMPPVEQSRQPGCVRWMNHIGCCFRAPYSSEQDAVAHSSGIALTCPASWNTSGGSPPTSLQE